MSTKNPSDKPDNTKNKCILNPDVVKTIIENYKQFILSVQNEAQIKATGLLETRDILIRELQEKFGHISYIRQVCIDEHHLISHSINVASLAIVVGTKIGLRQDDLKNLALAGLVHDVGKIKIPYQIILKHGQLNPKEFELYKLHVPLGFKIARDELKIDPIICRVIIEHHERNDGTGYPRGITEYDLHDYSKIIGVIDTFDLSINASINKRPLSVGEIAKELLSSGNKFSPQPLHTIVHMLRYSP
ncbi:MAG: HD domain-containing phosphohydrolase [Cyanobacteriota bacterium]